MSHSPPSPDSADDEPSPLLAGLSDEQRDRLADLLDQFLSSLESGAPLDADELTARHPDLREPLRLYLARLDELHEVSAGFAARDGDGGGAAPSNTSHDSSFEPPVGDRGARVDESLPPSARRLGDFLLGDEIGRGGMGIVYEARQISLDRRVALKVLPFASILDARTITRFKNEAKAAAQLQHPNIVPVFAVGAERGVHYYAMQFIEGRPLDQLLEQVRTRLGSATTQAQGVHPAGAPPEARRKSALQPTQDLAAPAESTVAVRPERRDRSAASKTSAIEHISRRDATRDEYYRAVVKMGMQAADALAAAHAEGIVHRDIKPSNLLFDHEGKLWVTDFGLARMQSDSNLSRTGDVVGTWRYMSPEQARGESALIDHRTDIYSLGATLWEMLAMRPAYEDDERTALLRQLGTGFPPPLAPHCPGLPVDLETVVLKAMAHEREERYLTADEFTADLRRVLEGKRPLARPPSLIDRWRRTARRHRKLAAAGLVVVVLIAAISTTATALTLRARYRAERNAKRAKENFDKARHIVDRLGTELADRLAELPGAASIRRDLLHDTLNYYHEFVRDAGDDPELQEVIADTYAKIGGLVGEFGSAPESIPSNLDAINRYERLLVSQPRSVDLRRKISVAQRQLADAYRQSGDTADARLACAKALQISRQLVVEQPDSIPLRRELAAALGSLGILMSTFDGKERGEAREVLTESIQILRQLRTESGDSPEFRHQLALALNQLGLVERSQASEALLLHQLALKELDQLKDQSSQALLFRRETARTHSLMGAAQGRLQRWDEAAAQYRLAIALWQPIHDQDPQLTTIGLELAAARNNLGRALVRLAQPALADAEFLAAIELQTSLVKSTPQDLQRLSGLASMYGNHAVALERMERPNDALVAVRQAIQLQRKAYGKGSKASRYRNLLDSHYVNAGRLLRSQGEFADAIEMAIQRKLLWPDVPTRLESVARDIAATADALEMANLSANEQVAEYRRQSDDILKTAEQVRATQAARDADLGDDSDEPDSPHEGPASPKAPPGADSRGARRSLERKA